MGKVRSDAGDVSIHGGTATATAVDTQACWGPTSQSTLTEEMRDGVLTITARCGQNGPISIGLGSCYRDIAVAAPASVGITVSVGAGDVRVTDVSGAVDLSSAAGEVSGLNLGGERLVAESSAGDVLVDALNAPADVSASSSAGDVEVRVPAGAYAIAASTSAGDVSIEGLMPDQSSARHIDAHTSSGDVRVAAR